MRQLNVLNILLLAGTFLSFVCILPSLFARTEEDQPYGTVIGIDLGTTFSVVAVLQKGRIVVTISFNFQT